MTEKNLLGLQIHASVKYTSDPDRNTTDLAAKLPRLFKDRLGIGGQWELMSDGERARLVFDAPFQSLSGKQQFLLPEAFARFAKLLFLARKLQITVGGTACVSSAVVARGANRREPLFGGL